MGGAAAPETTEAGTEATPGDESTSSLDADDASSALEKSNSASHGFPLGLLPAYVLSYACLLTAAL